LEAEQEDATGGGGRRLELTEGGSCCFYFNPLHIQRISPALRTILASESLAYIDLAHSPAVSDTDPLARSAGKEAAAALAAEVEEVWSPPLPLRPEHLKIIPTVAGTSAADPDRLVWSQLDWPVIKLGEGPRGGGEEEEGSITCRVWWKGDAQVDFLAESIQCAANHALRDYALEACLLRVPRDPLRLQQDLLTPCLALHRKFRETVVGFRGTRSAELIRVPLSLPSWCVDAFAGMIFAACQASAPWQGRGSLENVRVVRYRAGEVVAMQLMGDVLTEPPPEDRGVDTTSPGGAPIDRIIGRGHSLGGLQGGGVPEEDVGSFAGHLGLASPEIPENGAAEGEAMVVGPCGETRPGMCVELSPHELVVLAYHLDGKAVTRLQEKIEKIRVWTGMRAELLRQILLSKVPAVLF